MQINTGAPISDSLGHINDLLKPLISQFSDFTKVDVVEPNGKELKTNPTTNEEVKAAEKTHVVVILDTIFDDIPVELLVASSLSGISSISRDLSKTRTHTY